MNISDNTDPRAHNIDNGKSAMNTSTSCPMLRRLLAAIVLSAFYGAAGAGEPYRILPLGNSITQAEADRASYRYPLWKKLVDAGLEFDFVGSLRKHFRMRSDSDPPHPDHRGRSFDRDHEGHFGWTADEIINGRRFDNGSGHGRLAEWLTGYDADIALVHLGTNDAFRDGNHGSTVRELKEIIGILRADNPEVVVLLAELIPVRQGPGSTGVIESLNDAIQRLAPAVSTERSPVILVDHFSGFDPGEHTYDGVHPNEAGEKLMAQRWFDTIIAVTRDGS